MKEKASKPLCTQLSGKFSTATRDDFEWSFFISNFLRENCGDFQFYNPNSVLPGVCATSMSEDVTFLGCFIGQQEQSMQN